MSSRGQSGRNQRLSGLTNGKGWKVLEKQRGVSREEGKTHSLETEYLLTAQGKLNITATSKYFLSYQDLTPSEYPKHLYTTNNRLRSYILLCLESMLLVLSHLPHTTELHLLNLIPGDFPRASIYSQTNCLPQIII